MALEDLGRLFTALGKLPDVIDKVAELETRMTTQENVITRIDGITSALGDDVATLRTKFADLQSAIESGNQAAITNALDALGPHLDNLETMERTLRGIGADPDNPIPPGTPGDPAPSGG